MHRDINPLLPLVMPCMVLWFALNPLIEVIEALEEAEKEFIWDAYGNFTGEW